MSNTKDERIKKLEAELTIMVKDDELNQTRIIELGAEIEKLQHELKIKESYFHNMCAAYEGDIKDLKKLINIYKKSGNNYYLIDKDDFNEFNDFYSLLKYIDFMKIEDYKIIKGVMIDDGEKEEN